VKRWLRDAEAPGHYFAYGSNMSTQRLLARVPSASALGRAHFSGYRVVCNKPSLDGSGKANLVEAAETTVWGVVYRISSEDWKTLDDFEPRYTRHICQARLDNGEHVAAGVYVWLGDAPATETFDWYRDHLLRGAREHGLPREAIEHIDSLATRHDPRRSRRKRRGG
jgi:gamma-glutamylcyclotransferase